MFDRKKYKEFAKIQLKKRWLVPVLMSLIVTLVALLFSIPGYITEYRVLQANPFNEISLEYYQQIFTAIAESSGPFDNLLTVLNLVVEFILSYAIAYVYIKMSHSPEPVTMGDFFTGFESVGRAILIGAWRFLFLWLWFLLFMFPAIIKHYSYSMMYFLGAEYKNISITDLMNISKKITYGHKWELFVLDLSFIGWFLLDVITIGIAGLWIRPYYMMTKTNAYHAILKEALEKGIIRPENLA